MLTLQGLKLPACTTHLQRLLVCEGYLFVIVVETAAAACLYKGASCNAGLADPSEKIQAACANILAHALASHQLGGITRATLQAPFSKI